MVAILLTQSLLRFSAFAANVYWQIEIPFNFKYTEYMSVVIPVNGALDARDSEMRRFLFQ